MDDLRYPIGPFRYGGSTSPALRDQWLGEIAAAPGQLRAAVAGLSDPQLDTPYRPDGWTVRQVVHHLPDSHLNAYTRIKLALTEEEPTIKPYEEARWAELPDARSGPLEPSLALLDFLHQRWLLLLRNLRQADFARRYRHPEHGRMFELDEVLALYAWHGRHHVAHITSLRRRMAWD
ncbi:MAG: bacillithiol transferase BstA [Gemmatimonadota bacterium]|nr:bacillithiol transferase BstA [Gemmatimonadales bacterium]MDQ3207213.1 bacillithiol transferase BstA [Gemmatimonadota bacterium]